MLIKSISGKNFLSWGEFNLTIPKAGLIGIFGDNKDSTLLGSNSSGKSSLMESILFALFGRTLRQRPINELVSHSSDELSLTCEFENYKIDRSFRKGVSKANLYQDSKLVSSSINEISDILKNSLNLDYETFRRICYFEQGVVTRFANATDSDKKYILENILGIDIFDKCYKYTTDKLKEYELKLDDFNMKINLLSENITARKQLIQNNIENNAQEIKKLSKEKVSLSTNYEKLEKEKEQEFLVYEKAKQSTFYVDNLTEGQLCPICGTKITNSHIQKHKKNLIELSDIKNKYEEISSKASLMLSKINALEYSISSLKVKSSKQNIPEIDTSKIEKDINNLTWHIRVIKEDMSYFEFWKKGFSVKGIRAFVLSKILPFIENRANYYASYLTGGALIPELKYDNDKFIIDIVSGKNKRNYNLLSQGEKRRIDISIALSLQDVLVRKGASVSIAIYDEIFDSLDSNGISQAIELLKANSKDKCIFMITHRDELKELFEHGIIIEKKNDVSKIKELY